MLAMDKGIRGLRKTIRKPHDREEREYVRGLTLKQWEEEQSGDEEEGERRVEGEDGNGPQPYPSKKSLPNRDSPQEDNGGEN